jgi:hypothetical protein
MLGNLKGWLMSALIAAVVAGVIVWKGTIPGISDPTGKLASGMKPAALTVDPASLGIKPGTIDEDAGDIYRQAIAEHEKRSFVYDKYKDHVRQALTDNPPAVQLLLQAAERTHATLFSPRPEEIVNYDNMQDPIEGLYAVGMIANNMGLVYVSDKKYTEAQPYLRAAFILGQRLYDERLRFVEYYRGTDLMTSAVTAMQTIAKAKGEKDKAEQLGGFVSAVASLQKTSIQPIGEAISTIAIGPDGLMPYAGDMFVLAEFSQEPMWQTEALLKLGRMYYMKGVSAGDQIGAHKLLTKMAQNTKLPPPVKAAAVAGRDLTVEQFRNVGGGS